MNEAEIISRLENRLSSRRLQHSLEVARVARELASGYGVDPDKAYITGLLHDYAKGLDGSELLTIARAQFLLEDEVDTCIPDLLHAPVGAYLLETELGIDDTEILQAVKVHTLGALEMSALDKIIFLADMIEPGRDFPGLQRLQCLAERDLDRAMLFGLDSTIRYCLEQGRILHPLTIRVRNRFLQYTKE
ncbi:bis(5'-nucleosyl)-tetraphosphatase (symmetrical) YqeK [Syntrophomonas zehnderi]|nr:bis(5'-nucleosyl)-tetraphosphatase (symmetrical) YqeK [Syntrophomonas zehnderi]